MTDTDTRSLLKAVRRAGFFDPTWVGAFTAAAAAWGSSVVTPYAAAALRFPNRTAVMDEFGSLTYRQLDWRSTRVAGALKHAGLARDASVGILCRNHRGFLEAQLASAKIGARAVLLNTGLPPTQLAEVMTRENVKILVADRDLAKAAGATTPDVAVYEAAPEEDQAWTFPQLVKWRPLVQLPRPFAIPDPVVLTSGTTGAPKGTRRSASPKAALSAFGFVEAIPFQRGDVVVLPAPLFHAWGFSQMVLAATFAGTVVLRSNFDPEAVLGDIQEHSATVLAAVPVMLHRILESTQSEGGDLTSLRLVAASGSALPGELAGRWMDRFGDTLFNLYGSTEVGQISVATPSDLRAAPGTAGRPLRGISLKVVDQHHKEVQMGDVGEIVIESAMHFDGYTNGETKRVVDGFMSTGDRGRLDANGRLFVEGRLDDMIISGGENLFPQNIEFSLLRHASVNEVAVVGVPDEDLGHKVRAVVVADPVRVTNSKDRSGLTRSLKAHLRKDLAPFEIPREFLYVESLPRNAAGKILRRQLLD